MKKIIYFIEFVFVYILFIFFKFSIIDFFDLNKGPQNLPIKYPKLDESLYPNNLKSMNRK